MARSMLPALRDVVLGRVDHRGIQVGQAVPGQGMHHPNALYVFAPELDAQRLFIVGGPDLDHVALDPEAARRHLDVVALVLHVHQTAQDFVAADLPAHLHDQVQGGVFLGITEAVNARYRGDHDGVAARQQAAGRGVAQPLDLLVDGGVFFDEQVFSRHIGLGLVIVVVGNKELDGGVRKELPELGGQLRGQNLVGGHDQGRPPGFLDDFGNGVRFARTRSSQQRLRAQAGVQAIYETANGGRLVAGRSEFGLYP